MGALAVLAHPSSVPLVVRYDSQLAAAVAQAIATPEKHVRLAALAAVLWLIVAAGREVAFEHVYAHAGEPFNEFVGTLCGLASEVGGLAMIEPIPCATWVRAPLSQVKLLYLLAIPKDDADAYPRVSDDGRSIFVDLAHDGATALRPNILANNLDKVCQRGAPGTSRLAPCAIHVLSVNPRTLRRKGMLTLFLQQLHQFAIAIAGVSEARQYRDEITLKTSDDSGAQHIVATSAADATGNYGCAICISPSIPSATLGEKPILIEKRFCAIMRAEPRMMLVRIATP